MRNLLIIFVFLLSLPAHAAEPVHAIAMHGGPKHKAGFSHFSYANPNAAKGGTLNLGVVGSFDSLHPFIVRGNVPKSPAFGLYSSSSVYERLMARSWNEPFTLYGLIAKTIEVPEDRSEIIFNLRPEAHWQDGKPLTADDVVFSFKTLRAQGRPNHRSFYKKVKIIEKLSPSRVRFVFKKEPNGKYDLEMPLIMGLMPILPKHDWANREFNKTSLRIPLGSGPYKVSVVDPGRSLTLARDKNYWGQNLNVQKGLYNFDKVRIDYYRDDSIAMEAFLSGAFDLRRESDPKKWVKMKSHPSVTNKMLHPQLFPHKRTEAIAGFTMNLRRPMMKDKALRHAVSLAFDFEWINKALLYGMGKRTQSFFPNSELASPLPVKEPQDRRHRLLKAAQLLKASGYVLRDGVLFTPKGSAVSFEIMLSDPTEEKIALEWSRNLSRLGIKANVRTVDSSQYQERLTSFDYDVTRSRWYNSLSPGNEQMNYWSCAAAKANGSRNYMGVCDKEIDALATAIPAAKTRADLVNATRKLDHALLEGYYVVPFYYLGNDPIAYFSDRITPAPSSLYGPILESWWSVESR